MHRLRDGVLVCIQSTPRACVTSLGQLRSLISSVWITLNLAYARATTTYRLHIVLKESLPHRRDGDPEDVYLLGLVNVSDAIVIDFHTPSPIQESADNFRFRTHNSNGAKHIMIHCENFVASVLHQKSYTCLGSFPDSHESPIVRRSVCRETIPDRSNYLPNFCGPDTYLLSSLPLENLVARSNKF